MVYDEREKAASGRVFEVLIYDMAGDGLGYYQNENTR